MSVIDEPRPEESNDEGTCPVCGGQGRVWIDEDGPRFCLPCEGTGRRLTAPD